MSIEAKTVLPWGDGKYTFRLTLSGLFELEIKCKAPVAVLFNRMHAGEYSVNDIRETIRLGLIGGGMKDAEANALVELQFDNKISEVGFTQHHPVAYSILGAVMMGFVDHPLPPAAEGESPSSSTPQPSTLKRADLD